MYHFIFIFKLILIGFTLSTLCMLKIEFLCIVYVILLRFVFLLLKKLNKN